MACEKRTNGSLFYLATDGSDIKKNVALENSEEFLNASREALYILFDFNEPLSEWFELQVENFLQEFCLMASQFWRGAKNYNCLTRWMLYNYLTRSDIVSDIFIPYLTPCKYGKDHL